MDYKEKYKNMQKKINRIKRNVKETRKLLNLMHKISDRIYTPPYSGYFEEALEYCHTRLEKILAG